MCADARPVQKPALHWFTVRGNPEPFSLDLLVTESLSPSYQISWLSLLTVKVWFLYFHPETQSKVKHIHIQANTFVIIYLLSGGVYMATGMCCHKNVSQPELWLCYDPELQMNPSASPWVCDNVPAYGSSAELWLILISLSLFSRQQARTEKLRTKKCILLSPRLSELQ